MGKKCIICGEEAKFSIKDTSDHYCEECAKEHFSDISMLVKVEDQAKKIKELVEEADAENPLETDPEVDSEDDSEEPAEKLSADKLSNEKQ